VAVIYTLLGRVKGARSLAQPVTRLQSQDIPGFPSDAPPSCLDPRGQDCSSPPVSMRHHPFITGCQAEGTLGISGGVAGCLAVWLFDCLPAIYDEAIPATDPGYEPPPWLGTNEGWTWLFSLNLVLSDRRGPANRRSFGRNRVDCPWRLAPKFPFLECVGRYSLGCLPSIRLPALTQPSRCFRCMTNVSRTPAPCFLYIDPCPSHVRIVSAPIPAATVPVTTVYLPEKGPRNSWLPCRSLYRLVPCPICRVEALSDAAMCRPTCYL
jgi:hypothetical protein